MINCPACGGPTKPLFSSFYCVKECDLRKSRAIMADSAVGQLLRFDGKPLVYVKDPAARPEKWKEATWIYEAPWPVTPLEACQFRPQASNPFAVGWFAHGLLSRGLPNSQLFSHGKAWGSHIPGAIYWLGD